MKILADLTTKTFTVDEETLPHLYLGFRDNGSQNVTFNNLSFGYKITSGRKNVASGTYPAEGVQYVSSDQDYISSDTIEVTPETTYNVSVWVENAGERFEDKFSTTTPAAPVVEPVDQPQA